MTSVILLSIGILVSSPNFTLPKSILSITTLDQIVTWESQNITYKREPQILIFQRRDLWQTPQKTIELGTGDCEDLAFLNQYLLQRLGIPSQVLWVYRKAISDLGETRDYSHAICVFLTPEGWRFFSNKSLSDKHSPSIKSLLDMSYPEWDWYAEIQLPRKILPQIFRLGK